MANIYREEIEKQKKTLREYYGYSEDGAADLVIELICQLSIAEGKRQQHENCQKCLVPCGYCKGDGFTAEHNLESHEEGCNGCPVQVQCEYCHATGKVVPSDVALPSLSPRESGE